MIDLRSDTCSRPTEQMRHAIANATVGDDILRDDPTVKELEEVTADLLGKQDAVYVASGTMANQIAVRLRSRMGDCLITDSGAHVVTVEAASLAGLNGIAVRPVPAENGIFTADVVCTALAETHPFLPATLNSRPAMVWVENTHNNGGGTVWPVDELHRICDAAAEFGVAAHLDGARLWHAAVVSGADEREIAAPFDTVSVGFSKALGAPIGSALAGTAEDIAEARRIKQQLGGGFRQAGIIAAGALYALREHRPLLERTHEMASQLAHAIADLPGIVLDPDSVQTNIVRFELSEMPSGRFCEQLHEAGVFMLPNGPSAVRAVLYLDITESDVARAAEIIRTVLTD